MPFEVRNISIEASAGCGKTETLGLRLLAMTLAGIPPESICAMTFTRAAAGEIYERLLSILWKALKSDAELDRMRRNIAALNVFADGSAPAVDRASALALLRKLVDSMQTIGISTLDSFFARVVRAFSIELGLPSNAVIMDAAAEELRSNEIVRLLFRRMEDDAAEEWLESAKDLFFGDAVKRLLDPCLDLLEKADAIPALKETGSVWENPALPYPLPKEERARLFDVCAEWIAEKPALRERKFLAFLEACRDAEADTFLSVDDRRMLNDFFLDWNDLSQLKNCKKAFAGTSDAVYDAIRALVRRAGEIRLRQATIRTRAIRDMTRRRAGLYRKLVLDEGMMAFRDLPRLLTGGEEAGWAMEIAYRLNGRIRHWLLDEFQDTSREQWAVLDRILDGGGEGQSLFLVGDAKQAIYGWRNGDSKLMAEVRDAYRLDAVPQNRSYRYGRHICEALNFLFHPEHLETSAFPQATIRRWIGDASSGWGEHAAAVERPGELAIVQILPPDKDPDPPPYDEFHAFAMVVDAELARTRWEERPFSAAILVRRGKEAFQLKRAMEDVNPSLAARMIWEGDETIFSDPIIRAIVSFFVFLQHPGDTFYAEIVRMTPPFDSLLPSNPDALRRVREEWNVTLTSTGFRASAEELLRRCPESVRRSPVVDSFLRAAKDFDAAGRPHDAVAFRELIKMTKRRDAVDPAKIRILTMHGSKGLTFDMTFSLLTESGALGNFRKPDWSGFLSAGTVDRPRVLYAPGAPAVLEPELRMAADAALADEASEALCLLYVALTRAKHGSFLLCSPPAKKKLEHFHPDVFSEKKATFKKRRIAELANDSYRLQDFVFDSVFGDSPDFAPDVPLRVHSYPPIRTLVWRHGERDWFRSLSSQKKSQPRIWSIDWNGGGFRRRDPLSPSNAENAAPPAVHADFSGVSSRERAIEFGTKLHAWMERIAWLEDSTPSLPTDSPELAKHVRACLENPAFRQLFRKPDRSCRLLREIPFGVLAEDGNWISGRFDRVHLFRSPDGAIERAEILDYKSDRFDAEKPDALHLLAERHRPQMLLYRKAASSLFRLPDDRISVLLILTRTGDVLKVL